MPEWTCPPKCSTPHKVNYDAETKGYKCAWCGAVWGSTVAPVTASTTAPAVPNSTVAADEAKLATDIAAEQSAPTAVTN